MRRRFKADRKWITVRYSARCAEPNCQTEINPGERVFSYPVEQALYGTAAATPRKPNATLPFGALASVRADRLLARISNAAH